MGIYIHCKQQDDTDEIFCIEKSKILGAYLLHREHKAAPPFAGAAAVWCVAGPAWSSSGDSAKIAWAVFQGQERRWDLGRKNE